MTSTSTPRRRSNCADGAKVEWSYWAMRGTFSISFPFLLIEDWLTSRQILRISLLRHGNDTCIGWCLPSRWLSRRTPTRPTRPCICAIRRVHATPRREGSETATWNAASDSSANCMGSMDAQNLLCLDTLVWLDSFDVKNQGATGTSERFSGV